MRRPTAKDIVDGVVQALFGAQEPLDDSLVLVPARFEVYVHPEAYQELVPLLPRIEAQVKKKLDTELERLNSRRTRGLWRHLRRVFAPILRLLSAARYMHRQEVLPGTYERAGEAWHIEVGVTAEPDVGIDYLAIESDFGAQVKRSYKGRPTINITRRTTRLPDGRFETMLTTKRPGGSRTAPRSVATVADVLARLSYEDNEGRHIYYMKKDQILIGRRDETTDHLDIALATRPDVSREHLRIRHDARNGVFAIQDMSQYGATINGRKVPVPSGTAAESRAAWHPLPPVAEIGLADIVFIHFESLKP